MQEHMALYKYVEPVRIDVLRSGKIRFTPPHSLNDPFELNPYFMGLMDRARLLSELDSKYSTIVNATIRAYPAAVRAEVERQVLAMLVTEGEQLRHEFEAMSAVEAKESGARILAWVNRKLGMLALSEVPDDILMWSHYADGHKGMVLEFDDSHSWFNGMHPANPLFTRSLKVQYGRERPALVLDKFDQVTIFLAKSDRWKYEREVRVIRPLEEADEVRDGENIHLFQIPPACITAVVCGCRADGAVLAEVRELARTDPRWRHLKIRRAWLNEVAYLLHIRDDDV